MGEKTSAANAMVAGLGPTLRVYVGDTITAEAEVLSVHPSKPVTELRVHIRRTDGTTVLEGEAWCFTVARLKEV